MIRCTLTRVALLCLALAAVAVAGCGRRGYHKVSGRVHYPDGKPVVAGRVVVDYPDSPRGSWGAIRPDGSFMMGSYAPDDGILRGTFRVSIQSTHLMRQDGSTVELVDRRFADPETSGFSFSVPEQLEWDITVTKPVPVGKPPPSP